MAKSYREPKFSTLSVVPHDGAAHAPERDFVSSAPQLDQTREGLQSDQRLEGLQLERSANPPELNLSAEFPEVVEEKRLAKNKFCGLRGKTWMIALVVGVCILAIALGAGLEVGLKHNESSTPTSSHTTTAVFSSETRTTTSPLPEPTNPLPAPKSIRNDSSLAALNVADGSRRLFFQYNSGHIRQSIFASSTQSWPTLTSTSNTTNAKNNTLLAAITGAVEVLLGLYALHVFYINTSNSIAALEFNDGSWIDHPSNFTSPLSVAPGSRSLAAYALSGSSTPTAILFYESLNGSVVVLNRSLGTCDSGCTNEDQKTWSWNDISTSLYNGFRQYTGGGNPPLNLTAPFDLLHLEGNGSPLLQITFFDPGNFQDGLLWTTSYGNGSFYAGYPTFGVGVADTVDIKVSDLVIASTTYSLIVNRTQLECLACSDGGEAVQTVPGSSYPYTRLASISSGNSFFLYNQINDTTFAENFFDVAVGGWHESKNISIGTL